MFGSEWEDVLEAGFGIFGKTLKATREYSTQDSARVVRSPKTVLFYFSGPFLTILGDFLVLGAVSESYTFVVSPQEGILSHR